MLYKIEEDSDELFAFNSDREVLNVQRRYLYSGTVHSKVFSDNELVLEYTYSNSFFSTRIKIIDSRIQPSFHLQKKGSHYQMLLGDHVLTSVRKFLSTTYSFLYLDSMQCGCVKTNKITVGFPFTYEVLLDQTSSYDYHFLLLFVITLAPPTEIFDF